jgi:hypothetical protein
VRRDTSKSSCQDVLGY